MDEGGAAGDPDIPEITGLVELGSTPAAITYRGTDSSGRSVIVRVLRRDASAEVRARFEYDQARLTELREHPDIVDTLAHGYTAANQPYLVTEELTGGSLADRVGSGMDGPGVLAVGVKLAGALESAHRRNLVHGDLRPEDVLVTDDAEPHLTDLGVALVTGWGPDRATDAAGVAHAAPEQLDTHLPTPASDVYALGSILHALLAGVPAFVRPGDTSPMAAAMRIANEPPPDLRPAGVPGPVIDVIDKAMAKDPGARWESAEAMGHALQQAEVTLGLPITPMTVVGADLNPPRPTSTDEAAPPPAPTPPKGGGSKKGLLIGAGIAALVVVAAAAVLLLGGDDGDDDDGGFERAEQEEVDLVEVSDETGEITMGTLDRWDDVDGAPFFTQGDVVVADVLAAEDASDFLDDGGFGVSGIEATSFSADDFTVVTLPDGSPFPSDAQGLLDQRVADRDLADQCTTDLPPENVQVAAFDGLLQRFEGCDGNALVVFAGVNGDGNALVIEAHLVEAEDEAAIDAVLDSITVA